MKRTKNITFAALTAGLYVVLTLIASMMGLSNGVIQIRFSEALTILPVFSPSAIPGLTLGCMIANVIAGAHIFDVIFGSIATLIGACVAYLMRGLPDKYKWACTLPNMIANSVIVPFVLIYAYGVEGGYFALALSVGIGELVCGVICGSILYYSVKDLKIFR